MTTATPDEKLDISPAELEELFDLPAFEHDKGYRLVALDDPKTTMEFVAMAFMKVFAMPAEKAVELMLQIHVGGRAEIFKGSWDECKDKKDQIDRLNEDYDQNLFTMIEKIED